MSAPLVNRLLEAVRARGHVHRELQRRSREARRLPVIIVPGIMGVRLVDDAHRMVWGSSVRMFVGPGPAEVEHVRPAGFVDSFPVVPGIYHHDIFGALVRYVERIHGARLGEDLFVLAHDWRKPLAHGARELAKLIARVRGTTDEHVRLVGICSGGPIIRTFLAGGWRDDPADAFADPVLGPTVAAVERVIYMGAPVRGTFSGFDYLQDGITPAYLGYHHDARPLHETCQSIYDVLPHDGERIFVDATGAPLDLDHLDPRTWRELRLVGHDRPGLPADLARVRANHRLVAAAEQAHPPSIVIADRHDRATARAVIDGGRVVCPCDGRAGDVDRYPFAFEAGDGVVPAATMAAAPNQPADGPWWIETAQHDQIATDPSVHPLVVEALLAPLKPIPRARYLWPKNPNANASA